MAWLPRLMVLGSALLNSLFPLLVAFLGLSADALLYAWLWKSFSCLGFLCWLAWAGDVGRGNYRRPGVGMVLAALAAAVGGALAVSSETGSVAWEVSWRSWVGGGVALAGTVV